MKSKKLIVEDLSVSFKTGNGMVRAVRNISFELNEGETLAIVGESGSGKSVTTRAIMGILANNGVIDNGQIIYEGEDLTKIKEENFHQIRGKKIGMIFQDPLSSLNPIVKIGKQITEGIILNGNRYKQQCLKNVSEIKAEISSLELNLNKMLNEKDKDKTKTKEYKLEIKKKKKIYKQELAKEKIRVKREFNEKIIELQNTINELISKLPTLSSKKKKAVKQQIAMLHEKKKRVYKVTKKEAYERAIQVMNEVGIPYPERRFKQYPFQFSGGMRQRIVIAIALTMNPDVLICDEPTTALDVTIQAQILELINKLKSQRSLSVIFITHDLGVVANLADRVAVMYAGKIVEVGTTEDIFYNPKHPYTWALLSSMPDLESKERLEAIPGTPPNMLFPPKGDAFAARNKYALKIDLEQQPPMFKISDTHSAATWLLHKDAPKIDVPKSIVDRIERMKKLSLNEVSTNE